MESLDIIFTCLHDDWCKMSSILHIIFRSSPNHVEVQTGIFGCISLYLLYFNHLTHYFPIFVDLESIEISFHKYITLLFTINFIRSLTTYSSSRDVAFGISSLFLCILKIELSYNMSWRFMYQS